MQTDQLDRIEQKLDQLLDLLKKNPLLKKVKQTDEEWFADTKRQYHWIDWPNELIKMQTWLALPKNKGRQMTRDFIVNWINKIPIPCTVKVPVQAPPAYHKQVPAQPKGEAPPPDVIQKLGLKNWGRM